MEARNSFFFIHIYDIKQYINSGERMRKIIQIVLILCFSASFASIEKETNNIIYIDPGHGGIDGGCQGKDGTKEKELNLEISFILRELLENLGFVTKMTRSGDYDLAENEQNRKRADIEKRCSMINKSLLYISIHVNEYHNESASGAQVFYSNKNINNKKLATCIQRNLINELNNTNRSELEVKDKYLLNNIESPGCLVEVGFMSNSKELLLLKTSEYQEKICYGIVLGILDYINNI